MKIKKDFRINLSKFLITIVLTLIILIILKTNVSFKTKFYKYIFEDSISFVQINDMYEKYFGSPIPFKKYFEDKTKSVFNETLSYKEQTLYKDGVALTVDDNYLVPILESGMVIFVGDKDDYGKTVVIEQVDGLEIWYGNLENTNVSLYDYVEKGNLLGETKGNKLYLVYKKDGKVIKYDEQI